MSGDMADFEIGNIVDNDAEYEPEDGTPEDNAFTTDRLQDELSRCEYEALRTVKGW